MNDSPVLQLITKYASVLVGFYLLELMFSIFAGDFSQGLDSAGTYLSYSSALYYGLNIVTAIIIYKDATDLKIPAKYAALISIVYRPLGVIIFLLYALYRIIEEKKTGNIN